MESRTVTDAKESRTVVDAEGFRAADVEKPGIVADAERSRTVADVEGSSKSSLIKGGFAALITVYDFLSHSTGHGYEVRIQDIPR